VKGKVTATPGIVAGPFEWKAKPLELLVEDGPIAGKVTGRGYLGVAVNEVTPDVANAHGFGGQGGVLVAEVISGSPADRAGFQAGDIITQFNGQAVKNGREFSELVAATKPGSRASVRVWREGTRKELAVELGRLE
jgi:serine protease Do